MSGELDAAGIGDPVLRASYARCRALNARHGRTYFLATRLLSPAQRPAVHALYGFARWADDIVDGPEVPGCPRDVRLDSVARTLQRGLLRGDCQHPLLRAVVHTARRYDVDTWLFQDFLRSMRMDLTVTGYPDRAALDDYVRGSAEAIGLALLPVLGTTAGPEQAGPHAAALGKAFQLTNFLRDVAEDLDRGRVYLPEDELAAFNVDRDLLLWCRRNQRTDRRVRAALEEQHAITRTVYRFAWPGVNLLHPVSRPCVRTAFRLYSEILDRIEDSDYAVFAQRARVGRLRRARVAGSGFVQSLGARRSRLRTAAGHLVCPRPGTTYATEDAGD